MVKVIKMYYFFVVVFFCSFTLFESKIKCKTEVKVFGVDWYSHLFRPIKENDIFNVEYKLSSIKTDFDVELIINDIRNLEKAKDKTDDVRLAFIIRKDTFLFAKNGVVKFRNQYYANGYCVANKIYEKFGSKIQKKYFPFLVSCNK